MRVTPRAAPCAASPRRLAARRLGAALLAVGALSGCLSLDERQRQWIFQPSTAGLGRRRGRRRRHGATSGSSSSPPSRPAAGSRQAARPVVARRQRADSAGAAVPARRALERRRLGAAHPPHAASWASRCSASTTAASARARRPAVGGHGLRGRARRLATGWPRSYPRARRATSSAIRSAARSRSTWRAKVDDAARHRSSKAPSPRSRTCQQHEVGLAADAVPLITQRFDVGAQDRAQVGSPLLVVHGSEDRLIRPRARPRAVRSAPRRRKRFVLVEGGSHHNTNALAMNEYRSALHELFGLQSVH